jgi:hypothetical protein
LLLLKILEVDDFKILWQLILYAMIGRPETSKRTKERKQYSKQKIIDNMMQWLDRFCRYETFGVKIT